jgi:hypothetical protein
MEAYTDLFKHFKKDLAQYLPHGAVVKKVHHTARAISYGQEMQAAYCQQCASSLK